MANKSNHHLVEVLCAFWFNPSSNIWDSTFFGKYYEIINGLGYTEKTEQKAVKVKFELKPEFDKTFATQEADEGNSKMIFRDSKNGYAIIMSANFLSFHKVAPYKNWELLMKEQVIPGMKAYEEIGLGKDIVQVQALYINQYEIGKNDKISDYFKFIPSVSDFGIGQESNLVFQSQYDLEPNLMQQIKMNSILDPAKDNKDVFLECSCFASAHMELKWEELAQSAHDQNNKVFKTITKE
ncbi:MAG: TIGR04255 family protein [Bacteroidota bacterium]|nr:TIGR04255 family protein [Bacteroidota bacterium]